MNADLTVKTKSFVLVYSDKDGSLRRASPGLTATGNTTLTVAHQDYVDSKTKVPGVRSNVRFQLEAVNASTGNPMIAFAQLTFGRPSDPTITDADMAALVDAIRQMLATTAADAAALNLSNSIVVNREQ